MGDQEQQSNDDGDDDEEGDAKGEVKVLGEERTESDDDDVEYNPHMLVSPIDVLGPLAKRAN